MTLNASTPYYGQKVQDRAKVAVDL